VIVIPNNSSARQQVLFIIDVNFQPFYRSIWVQLITVRQIELMIIIV